MPPMVGFCFDIREGVQLFSGFQALTAIFWISSLPYDELPWPSDFGLLSTSVALLLVNALLGATAVRWRSETCAFVVLMSYTMLLVCLTADFVVDHPSSCTVQGGSKSQLGILLANLLWTTDACLLMTILGWVTIAVGYLVSLYFWYMYLWFWRLLREATADARLVRQAISSLQILRHKGKDTEIPVLEGREPSETATCAICLCDFETNEELRLLPCVHLFHKPCIDVWIRRQGLAASCPLCKRLLLPRHAPASALESDESERVDAAADATAGSSTGASDAHASHIDVSHRNAAEPDVESGAPDGDCAAPSRTEEGAHAQCAQCHDQRGTEAPATAGSDAEGSSQGCGPSTDLQPLRAVQIHAPEQAERAVSASQQHTSEHGAEGLSSLETPLLPR